MRRIAFFPVLTLVLHIAAGLVLGQETLREVSEDDLTTVKARVDQFFQSLTNRSLGPDRAFPELISMSNGPLKDRNEEIAKLIEQALALDQRYGVYTGHELASTKTIGADLIFLRYLYKAERFPVVFYFTFYRPGPVGGVQRDWTLIALRFDARIDALEK
jgi:hypothetical protein